jgi:hypothetical protein
MDKVKEVLYNEIRKVKSKIFQKEKEVAKLKITLAELEAGVNKN